MLGDFLVVPTRGGAPSGIWQVEATGAAEDAPLPPQRVTQLRRRNSAADRSLPILPVSVQ